jgi:hypothetical protein
MTTPACLTRNCSTAFLSGWLLRGLWSEPSLTSQSSERRASFGCGCQAALRPLDYFTTCPHRQQVSNCRGAIRRSRVRQVPLSEAKDDLSHYPRDAEKQGLSSRGMASRPECSLDFESVGDWFDYRLENDAVQSAWQTSRAAGHAQQDPASDAHRSVDLRWPVRVARTRDAASNRRGD